MSPEGWNWTFNLKRRRDRGQVAPVITVFIKSNLSSNRQFGRQAIWKYRIPAKNISCLLEYYGEAPCSRSVKIAPPVSTNPWFPGWHFVFAVYALVIRRTRQWCDDRIVEETRTEGNVTMCLIGGNWKIFTKVRTLFKLLRLVSLHVDLSPRYACPFNQLPSL